MRWVLAPLAWLYGGITGIRNWLFDNGICSSYEAQVKTICVGNLSVGGSGKTPHVAYLAELLHTVFQADKTSHGKQIAILSRGYKRKTTGYVEADENATSERIGDEPYQQHQNLPYAIVAVDERRHDGLIRLQKNTDNLSVVILDDAFQHRAVKAGLNILLTPYDRLFSEDHLMPWGHLRENRQGAKRADFIVVTKCPEQLSEEEKYNIKSIIRKYNNCDVYFSTIIYDHFKSVFPHTASDEVFDSIENKEGLKVLVVTGIAKPEPMYEYLKEKKYEIKTIKFADHYCFSEKDFVSLQNEMNHGGYDILLTTEKDAARMQTAEAFPDELKAKVYMLPISVSLGSDTDMFNHKILQYVGLVG